MSDERGKMIDKIRKLLALAGSSNENEAALAANRAQALLAEHNLTMQDVHKKEGEDEGFVMDEEIKTDSYPWRRQLATMVAKLYFCTYFYQTVQVKKTRHDIHVFIGAKHNLAVAKMMFVYLHTTVDRLAKEGAKSVSKKHQSPYRVSFRSACTVRLQRRIAERIEEARKGGTIKTESGNTLPALASMYDRIGAKLDKFMEENVGGLTHKKSKLAMINEQGTADGNEAGKKIGLDAQVEGSTKGRLLSHG